MAINHELWRVVASGGLNLLLERMQLISDIDTRSRLNDKPDFTSWLRVELAKPTSLAFAISEQTLGLLWREVNTTAYYAPEIREQDVPMPTNASSDGTTLSADSSPEGYILLVYSFDGLTFSLIGNLDSNSQPGAGTYVIVTQKENDNNALSLPSLFLTVS